MSLHAVASPAITTVPVAGSDAVFPVRRVYCVGRNYADHAIEMGVDPRAEAPFFFCKPADAVLSSPTASVAMAYPPQTANLHHEVELVVAIGKRGADIPVEQAANHIFGHAVGLDMTRRDLQQAMRRESKPWEIGKVFDHCAPMGAIHPIGGTGELTRGRITLQVNDTPRQDSDLSKLIWSVNEIISTLSRFYTLEPGDLVFTGTPEGVGPVGPGDRITAAIEGLGELRLRVLGAAS